MAASDRPRAGGVAGAALVRLYPRDWRSRYEAELLDVLASREIDVRDRIDLVRGAIDAHLHPRRPAAWPAKAAVVGGAAWTLAGVFVAVQPVQPDWPGYLIDVVPLAMVGVVALLLTTIGAWLRLGDGVSGPGRIALDVAVAGHLVWLAALVAVLVHVDYGLSTVVASTTAALGAVAVGACLLRAGDERVGTLFVITPVALLLASPVVWLAMGLGWTAIGWLLRPPPLSPSPS